MHGKVSPPVTDPRIQLAEARARVKLAMMELDAGKAALSTQSTQAAVQWVEAHIDVARANLRQALGEEAK